MSISEKRERCRTLQSTLVAILGEQPNPSEITGAAAYDLEPLATLYESLIEKMPLLQRDMSLGIRDVDAQALSSTATSQQHLIEQLNIRTVPFSKEMLLRMKRIVAVATIAPQWIEYDVEEQLAFDFLSVRSVNPPIGVLVDVYGKRQSDVEAMLIEAKHRSELRGYVTKMRQILDCSMSTVDLKETNQELEKLLLSVEPHSHSLSLESADLARLCRNVVELLNLYLQGEGLMNTISQSNQRLKRQMPSDPSQAFSVMENIRNEYSHARLRDVVSQQEPILDCLQTLRDVDEQLQMLHREAASAFPRLALLSKEEIETFIGSDSLSSLEKVLTKTFNGISEVGVENNEITSVTGVNGEVCRLKCGVRCDRRPDKVIGELCLRIRESMFSQFKQSAEYAHRVAVGSLKFDWKVLRGLLSQAAVYCVQTLFTILAEGSFSRTEITRKADSSQGESSRADISLDSSASRVASAHRLTTIIKRQSSSSGSLEPRPGSASPNLFKKSKEFVTDRRASTTKRVLESTLASQIENEFLTDFVNEAVPLLPCATKERPLSTAVGSSGVTSLLEDILQQFVSAKFSDCRQNAAWYDRVIAVVYHLLRRWEGHVQHLCSGDAAWRKEPRTYFLYEAASFEIGPLRLEHELEFCGHTMNPLLFSDERLTLWCKFAVAISLKKPFALVGPGDLISVVMSFAHLTGRFVAVLECASETTASQVCCFLNVRSFFRGFWLLRSAHLLSKSVVKALARNKSLDWSNVVLTSLDDMPPALQRLCRVVYVSDRAEDSAKLGASLNSCGFHDQSVATKIMVLRDALSAVCGHEMKIESVLSAIQVAGSTLFRNGKSITPDQTLRNALEEEVLPQMDQRDKEFCHAVLKNLFKAESNVTFFSQVIQSAIDGAGAIGISPSNEFLEQVVKLYDAILRASQSGAVVTLRGTSSCGKSSALSVAREVYFSLMRLGSRPTLLHLHRDNEESLQSIQSSNETWIFVDGRVSPTAQLKIEKLVNSRTTNVVAFVEADDVLTPLPNAWSRTLTVYFDDWNDESSWFPAVRSRIKLSKLQRLFELCFQGVLGAAISCRLENSASVPASRMTANTIMLCEELVKRFAVEEKHDGDAMERIFWLSCTWGCSTSPRVGWNEFVASQLSEESQLPPNLSIEDVFLDSNLRWISWSLCGDKLHQANIHPFSRAVVVTPSLTAACVIGELYLARCSTLTISGSPGQGKTLAALRLLPQALVVAVAGQTELVVPDDKDVIFDGWNSNVSQVTCANARFGHCKRIFISQSGDQLARWCPTIFVESKPFTPLLIQQLSFTVKNRAIGASLERLWMSFLNKQSLSSLVVLHELISQLLIARILTDAPSMIDSHALLVQHISQKIESQEVLEELQLTSREAFGLTEDTGSSGIVLRDTVTGEVAAISEEGAVALIRGVAPSCQVTPRVAKRVASIYWCLTSENPVVLIEASASKLTGNILGEVHAAAELLKFDLIRNKKMDIRQRSLSAVYYFDADGLTSSEDATYLADLVVSSARVVVNAVHVTDSAVLNFLRVHFSLKAHRIISTATVADLRSVASLCVGDPESSTAISEIFWSLVSSEHTTSPVSLLQFHDAICQLDGTRKALEHELNERIEVTSAVLKFLRRIEIAASGKALTSVAEQQYEVREETSNRALEGKIIFRSLPQKPLRLIAQFSIHYEDQRIQEVAAPSVFFGTTREDVVAIPAVNGGTCRARCDGLHVNISTGILDFQLTAESIKPLVFVGTVTDPSQGHSAVGKVILQQVIEGENILNKKWLRFGAEEPDMTDDMLNKPMELPSEAMLQLNRMETDRYVSRVGSMCRTLQPQVEQVLQKQFAELMKIPSVLAGQSLVPFLIQLQLKDRQRVIQCAQATSLTLFDPLSLMGLASLLRTNVYSLEQWLTKMRAIGLAQGDLAEQNACALRYLIDQAMSREEAATEDNGGSQPKPIVVLENDEEFASWCLRYCQSRNVAVVRRPTATTMASDTSTSSTVTVQLVSSVSPIDCVRCHVIETTETVTSLKSKYQMLISRPEGGSNAEGAAMTTLRTAEEAQRVLDEGFVSLLGFLHDQYETAEAQSSVAQAIIEIGKDKVPALMEATRKTKDSLAAADTLVDRTASRWKNMMENAEPLAQRVALLQVATCSILPRLSPSYVISQSLASRLAREALSVSGKNAQVLVDAATKLYCTAIMNMLRLEHKLDFGACLSAWILTHTTAPPPLCEALVAARDADAETHVERERLLKLEAVEAFEEYKARPVPTGKSKGAQAQRNTKELKDFLSPEIKPSYYFLTYPLWAKIVAISKTLPNWSSLLSGLQPSDVPMKGGVLRQDKWTEWFQMPTVLSVPGFEKDPTVTILDKLMLLHVARPERTHAGVLQLISDTLGNEIPDPLAFEELAIMLVAETQSRVVIVYTPTYTVDISECMSQAQLLRSEASKKSKQATTYSNSTTVSVLHVEDADATTRFDESIARDDWILVEGMDACGEDTASLWIQTMNNVRSDYSGMIVLACDVQRDQDAVRPLPKILSTPWPRIACNEPSSIRGRMQRFYSSDSDVVPQTTSNSHRIVFLLNFLVAAVAQRCRYEQASFSEPERLSNIDADVNAATLFLHKQVPSHSLKHWDEIRGLLSDIVGSNVRDQRDKAIILALIDWLIHPDVASQDQLGFLNLPTSSQLTAHLESVGRLASVDAAETIGLHANEERRLQEREGRRLMSHICQVISRDSHASFAARVTSAAEAVKRRLPPVWSASEVLQVHQRARHSALNSMLSRELDSLMTRLERIHADVSSAIVGEKAAVSKLRPILDEGTPLEWLELTHGKAVRPHRAEALAVWIESITTRSNQLRHWARNGFPRVVALGSLFHIDGFLAAYLLDACQELSLDPSTHMVRISVVPPTVSVALPNLDRLQDSALASGIYIVGSVMEGASIGPDGAMQEPPDLVSEWWKDLTTPIGLLKMKVEENALFHRHEVATLKKFSGLNRIQAAITFSRTNAAVTLQRPSSAASSRLPPLAASPTSSVEERSMSAVLGQTGEALSPPRRGHISETSSRYPHMFFAPLYRSSLRRQEDYVCDIPIDSHEEHNYWMIHGAVVLCEP